MKITKLTLNMENSKIEDFQIIKFSKVLPKLTKLESLYIDLSRTRVIDDSFYNLLCTLPSLPQISQLCLGLQCCGIITDRCLNKALEVFESHYTLLDIHLMMQR
eukprot:TRINITY_DN7665_c0_g1_i2.p1 TRINITY_DN7665_c0_g1~~TRINITY_DN7665_c0_g1_i2.p1  ORF type:complete len:104 (-),score=4.20 TRINITY_DN7665_c0_g1_i2:193-504(-)